MSNYKDERTLHKSRMNLLRKMAEEDISNFIGILRDRFNSMPGVFLDVEVNSFQISNDISTEYPLGSLEPLVSKRGPTEVDINGYLNEINLTI